MDVTPRELRDVEIREAFRGYNRDEVNDLLERAAVAIEALNERTRVLGERLANAQPDSGRGRETEDMLHRTLLLAQRAADEAIAEAEEKARVMLEEAETRSRRMLADAAVEAHRTTEAERGRLEQEIAELQGRRDALSTDLDGLANFESDYRSRLVSAMEADLRAIESDLQAIRERAAAASLGKPTMNAGNDADNGDDANDADPAETKEVDVRGFLEEKPRPLVGSGSGPAPGTIAEAATAGASELVGANAADVPEGAGGDEPQPRQSQQGPRAGSQTTIDLFGAEQAASDSAALDDDSFFASLRDAVRDDAPLGPRDASEQAFFDQDSKDAPSFRETFKRRR
jgi:cell division initiation protein